MDFGRLLIGLILTFYLIRLSIKRKQLLYVFLGVIIFIGSFFGQYTFYPHLNSFFKLIINVIYYLAFIRFVVYLYKNNKQKN